MCNPSTHVSHLTVYLGSDLQLLPYAQKCLLTACSNSRQYIEQVHVPEMCSTCSLCLLLSVIDRDRYVYILVVNMDCLQLEDWRPNQNMQSGQCPPSACVCYEHVRQTNKSKPTVNGYKYCIAQIYYNHQTIVSWQGCVLKNDNDKTQKVVDGQMDEMTTLTNACAGHGMASVSSRHETKIAHLSFPCQDHTGISSISLRFYNELKSIV
jgi:hypothetical protein